MVELVCACVCVCVCVGGGGLVESVGGGRRVGNLNYQLMMIIFFVS